MSTLLLVGGESATESGGVDQSAPRKAPTMRRALERVGYEVVKVDDAAGALARLDSQRPDLIVVAGVVPDMDLRDLCAALRRDPVMEKVPFVLVADAAAKAGGSAARVGADLVFPASVGPAEVADRLRRLF